MRILPALLVLVLLQDPPDPERLVEKLRSESFDERQDATRRLKELGRPAIAALERVLKDPDAEVRLRSAQVLRLIQLRDRLGPRLLQEVPGIDDRLVDAPKEAWTAELLRIIKSHRKDDVLVGLKPWDLDPLVGPAFDGAFADADAKSLIHLSETLPLPTSFPALKRLSEGPEDDVAGKAMRALGKVDPAAAGPVLAGLLQSASAGLRMEVLQVLRDRLGSDLVGIVRPMLKDRDASVQCEAAQILGLLGDVASAPALEALMSHKSEELRKQAAEALGRIGDPRSAGALRKALQDDDDGVRGEAMEALGRLGDVEAAPMIVRRLEGGEDSWVIRRAASALVRLDHRAAVKTLAALTVKGGGSDILAALWKLGARDEAVKVAGRLLQSEDWTEVYQGAEALKQGRAKEGIPALREALKSAPKKAHPSIEAALALLTRPDPPPLPDPAALAAKLSSENEDVRWQATKALLFLGPAATEALNRVLADGPPRARSIAASLRTWREGGAALKELLADPRAEVREGALEGFRFGKHRGVPDLILKALDDPADGVRKEAWWNVSAASLPVDPERLKKLFADPDPDLRETAIEIADALQRVDFLPLIRDRLDDSSYAVAGQALDTLACRGDESVGPFLRTWLRRGGSYAESIARGLGRRQDGRFEDILGEIALHEDSSVRSVAARILCRRGRIAMVPVILEHDFDLDDLNALRQPKLFKALTDAPSVGLHLASGRDLLDRCSKLLRMPIEVAAPAPGPRDLDDLSDPLNFPVLDGRNSLFEDLRVGGWGLAVVLEPDRIRLLSREDAAIFWERWWRALRNP